MNTYFVRYEYAWSRKGVHYLEMTSEESEILQIEDILDKRSLTDRLIELKKERALDIHNVLFVTKILLINKL